MNIGVVFGGKSVEHEISIITAYQVIESLKTASNKVFPLYVSKDNDFYYASYREVNDYKDLDLITNRSKRFSWIKKGILIGFKKIKLDMVILAMHGTYGEDGKMGGILEYYDIPYTGPSNIAGGIAQDKIFMKGLMFSNGIRTLPFYSYEDVNESILPVILKPAHLGSSIGIEIAHTMDEFKEKYNKIKSYDNRILIEKYIDEFREMNCAVRGYDNLEVSKIEEVHKTNDLLSYEDKYEKSIVKKREFVLDNYLITEIKNMSLKLFKEFDLFGVARIDFIVINDIPYVNEINSIPGSLAYYLFDGSMMDHLTYLMKEGMKRYLSEKKKIFSIDKNILSLKSKK